MRIRVRCVLNCCDFWVGRAKDEPECGFRLEAGDQPRFRVVLPFGLCRKQIGKTVEQSGKFIYQE